MARIQVQALQIDTLRGKLVGVKNKSADAAGNVAKVKANLDWQVASRSNIDERLASVQKRIQKQADLMNSYTGFLNTVNSQFGAKDGELRNRAKEILYQLGQVGAAMVAIAREKVRTSYKTDQTLIRTTAAGAMFGAAPVEKSSLSVALSSVKQFYGLLQILAKYKSVPLIYYTKKGLEAKRKELLEEGKAFADNRVYWAMINRQVAEMDKYIELLGRYEEDISKNLTIDLEKSIGDIKKMKKNFSDDPIAKRMIEEKIAAIDAQIAYNKKPQMPLPKDKKYILNEYGIEPWPISGKHTGIDLHAPPGTSIKNTLIKPIAEGIVLGVEPTANTIYILHSDGTVSGYGHCNVANVRKGQIVTKDTEIGTVGNKGVPDGSVHLHLSVYAPCTEENNGAKIYEKLINQGHTVDKGVYTVKGGLPSHNGDVYWGVISNVTETIDPEVYIENMDTYIAKRNLTRKK